MDTQFSIATEHYQGPLEVLLDLIESQKMSISEVSLAQVCDTYITYIEKLSSLPLHETAQFILVASTLLLIKSRTLLPHIQISEEEGENIQELQYRLAILAQFRTAAKSIKSQWNMKPLMSATVAPTKPVIFAPGESTIARLYTALEQVIRSIPVPEHMRTARVSPLLALEDVIRGVRERVSQTVRARFSELTRGTSDKHEVIVYFLAFLELVRSGSHTVTQERLFADITIEVENALSTPSYV